MIKKVTLSLCFILFVINCLSFAQTENPYTSFTAEQLKNNKEYSKNYNPITCKPKILYNCMLDMINLARQELNFAMPLTKDSELDSMAIVQGEYQAKKMLKTSDNVYPYQNLDARFKSRGYSPCGEELLSKAKTSQGIDEYSYYDLCWELLKPILKNVKQAKILLNPKYTYIGFGWGVDNDMKNVYATFVLGNDRVKNEGKPTGKNLPYSKKQNGLSGYDEKICAKCNEDKSLEVLSNYLKLEGDEVYFVCDDYKALRKLIGKEDDAIALDFVQHDQFDCEGGNKTDNSLVNRGFMTQPFTYLLLLDNNEITDKKSTKMRVHVENVPEEIESNKFDINILIIKGGTVCRTIIKKNVEAKNSAYSEVINFVKDETTIATTGDFVPVDETGKIELKIPFDPAKSTYTFADIAPYLSKLDKPYFKINKVEIIAHNSLNYAKDAKQIALQKKRAESIQAAFKGQYAGEDIAYDIKYDNSWEEFKKDVVYSENYYDLTLGTEEDAYAQLVANKGKIAKELENDYLQKHRFAKIILHVTYVANESHEEDLVIYKLNNLLNKKKPNTAMAMAVQKYMMKQVEAGKYSSKVISNVKIPQKAEFQAFLNNQLYMQCLLEKRISNDMVEAMAKVSKLNAQNVYAAFNQMDCEIQTLALKNISEISVKQANIDKLYTSPLLSKESVNNLNLEYQIKVIEFLKNQPKTMETTTLLTQTYDKIKQIRNPKLTTWQNAYKLAAIFVQNGDYAYALSLMNPFLDDKTISNDFIFSYVSLGGYKEEVYLSDNYAKMVALAAEKDRTRLCNLTDKMSICIMENVKVKKILCEKCK
ncbi:MAG: CAP domain-containing protein [Bacteroidales bacterium]|nr:CAP domain-containing protein [Bacteroidales bacterium]